MTLLFRDLLRQPTHEWTQDKLELLPVKELQAMCTIVGITKSGNHDQLVARIIDLTELQRCIRRYHQDLDQEVTTEEKQALAKTYKGKELKAMCKRAGIYAPGTKFGMAASLIAWSRNCLRTGREAVEQARKVNATKPAQRHLF